MSDIDDLQRIYTRGDMGLFMGAGVSKSCGLPDWSELSKAIIAEAWPDRVTMYDYGATAIRGHLARSNPLDAMRRARQKLGTRFNETVRSCLYKGYAELSATVHGIASLGKVDSICCFNYDDLLEEALISRRREFSSVIDGDEIHITRGFPIIYHPHGYLPSSRTIHFRRGSPIIILSEDDYHQLYSSPYSWANVIQIMLLMTKSILFVGMSLTDPNTRRLLDICKRMNVDHRHYAILQNPRYHPEATGWGGIGFTGLDSFEAESLTDLGITPLWYNEYGEIPSILHKIAEPTALGHATV